MLTGFAVRYAMSVLSLSFPVGETASIIRYDKGRYRARHLIENAFCRLKDFRRVATRYDKLAATSYQAWRSPPLSPSGCE